MSRKTAKLERDARNNPAVRQFLDLSTAHLSQSTRELLDHWGMLACNEGATSPLCGSTGYGWIVHAPPERSDAGDTSRSDPSAIPDDLWLCMVKAHELGCDYILFDRDAATLDGLPTYKDGTDEIETEADRG